MHQTLAGRPANRDGLPLQVSEFVNDGLAGAVNFQIKCAIFVRSRQVSDDPCKLISIEFTCGKLGDLIEAVSVAAEDLYTKTIRPIGASISGVCSNDVVSGVNWLFPDFERGELVRAFEDFGVLEV